MNLAVNNLVKAFEDKRAVDDISFVAESGKAFGLLGRNGAGKTTTIRMIMGLYTPDSGNILLDGKPFVREYGSIGYLPEERGLYPKRGILEQLVYFGRLRGMTVSTAKKRSMYWLERLELSEYAGKKLDILSKGNQQKIQLAQALLSEPDILVLDEPFSGLDPVNATMLKNIVKEQIAEGKVVIFSSHQMNYIEEFCDNIAILKDGKIVTSGSIREIKRSYDRTKLVVGSDRCSDIERELSGNPLVASMTMSDSYHLTIVMKLEDSKNALMQTVASLGIDYDKMYIEEPSLADIFVHCTED